MLDKQNLNLPYFCYILEKNVAHRSFDNQMSTSRKKTKWHINIHNEKNRKGENKNRGGEGLKFVHIGSQLPIPQLPW